MARFVIGLASANPPITTCHIIGALLATALMVAAGLYAGSKVKIWSDHSGSSRKAGPAIVGGTLIGTIVGGASTIGTAQMAYQYGLCAWWFAIGGGIGVFMLGGPMLKPLYTSNKETIPQFLVGTYSEKIRPLSSVLASAGIFLAIMGQGISTVALVTSIFDMNTTVASIIGIGLVWAYVVAGGVVGTGVSGLVKTGLLYFTAIVTGYLAFKMLGGMSGIHMAFPAKMPWYSLFGRGFAKDIAAGISLVVGILSTQTYFQAILSGKTINASRQGAMIASALIPPIGIGGVMVGLYMRANAAMFPGLKSAECLPTFIIHFLPPVVAGIVLATLLFAVVGTWAGLSLGVSTMLTRDIYERYINPNADSKKKLLVQRGLIVIVSVIATYFISTNAGNLIMGFSILSLALRACVNLMPLLGAMFFPRLVTPAAGISACVSGPVVAVYWAFVHPKGMDPLYPGILTAFLALLIVSIVTKNSQTTPKTNMPEKLYK